MGWLRHLCSGVGVDFEALWAAGSLALPEAADDGGLLGRFRADPESCPLPTPSGRIEIVSGVIEGFGYDDCPAHPSWLAPADVPGGAYPLWLVANQPATRLHSQLDFGAHSQGAKRRGREVLTLHPADAAARGVGEGDVVRVWNARGSCLAAVRVSEGIAVGVAQLPTGAWYDPEEGGAEMPLCVHGNPNVLTRDVGTSRLAQGVHGAVDGGSGGAVWGNLPPIRAYEPPG